MFQKGPYIFFINVYVILYSDQFILSSICHMLYFYCCVFLNSCSVTKMKSWSLRRIAYCDLWWLVICLNCQFFIALTKKLFIPQASPDYHSIMRVLILRQHTVGVPRACHFTYNICWWVWAICLYTSCWPSHMNTISVFILSSMDTISVFYFLNQC